MKTEMGRTCSTYEGEERYIQWGNSRDGDNLKTPGVDGKIILKLIFKRLDGGIGWIDLAQDRERWRALVNAVMNLRVP
jgi:hypothetical protein